MDTEGTGIYLQSLEIFQDVGKVTLETGSFEVFSKAILEKEGRVKTQGLFSFINRQLICFYRHKSSLFLRINEDTFEISEECVASIKKGIFNNSFQFSNAGSILIDISYPKIDLNLQNDPTPFIEEEDFDLFLLIKNVLGSKERRKLFFNDQEQAAYSDLKT